jgi:hypothetical protein
MGLYGLAVLANPSGSLFSGLPSVALYCVRGGVKVVSGVRGLRAAGSRATEICGQRRGRPAYNRADPPPKASGIRTTHGSVRLH